MVCDRGKRGECLSNTRHVQVDGHVVLLLHLFTGLIMYYTFFSSSFQNLDSFIYYFYFELNKTKTFTCSGAYMAKLQVMYSDQVAHSMLWPIVSDPVGVAQRQHNGRSSNWLILSINQRRKIIN